MDEWLGKEEKEEEERATRHQMGTRSEQYPKKVDFAKRGISKFSRLLALDGGYDLARVLHGAELEVPDALPGAGALQVCQSVESEPPFPYPNIAARDGWNGWHLPTCRP